MDVLDARLLAASSKPDGLPPPMFAEVAFAGRSNVGKSSLINMLARRHKLVRTSSTPGSTRVVQIFRLKLRGAELDFVDLPGYGYAARSKSERKSWGPMIEGFLRSRPGLRAVLVLVDARRGVEPDDEELLSFLDSVGLRGIIVITKCDKLGANDRRAMIAKFARDGRTAIATSSSSGTGREELWKLVLEASGIVLGA